MTALAFLLLLTTALLVIGWRRIAKDGAEIKRVMSDDQQALSKLREMIRQLPHGEPSPADDPKRSVELRTIRY